MRTGGGGPERDLPAALVGLLNLLGTHLFLIPQKPPGADETHDAEARHTQAHPAVKPQDEGGQGHVQPRQNKRGAHGAPAQDCQQDKEDASALKDLFIVAVTGGKELD